MMTEGSPSVTSVGEFVPAAYHTRHLARTPGTHGLWPQKANPGSSPDPLDPVAQTLQRRHQSFPLVALNFDPPVFHRPSRPAPLLERGGEFEQAVFVKRN